MNETIEVIKSRRSHRKYRPEQISEAELQTIMEAAVYAPSAMNQQKWHFTVISDKAVLEKVVKTIKENIMKSGIEMLANRAKEADFNVFHHAPAVVLITAEEKAHFAEIDCAAAAQNIALAAESLNIGSCLIAMSGFIFQGADADELKKELGIPNGYKHIISVALGYKEDENPPTPLKKMDVINYIR
jgi:nitroreductase